MLEITLDLFMVVKYTSVVRLPESNLGMLVSSWVVPLLLAAKPLGKELVFSTSPCLRCILRPRLWDSLVPWILQNDHFSSHICEGTLVRLYTY